jgi:hypothetical protein
VWISNPLFFHNNHNPKPINEVITMGKKAKARAEIKVRANLVGAPERAALEANEAVGAPAALLALEASNYE